MKVLEAVLVFFAILLFFEVLYYIYSICKFLLRWIVVTLDDLADDRRYRRGRAEFLAEHPDQITESDIKARIVTRPEC